jgi:hypothetical protein
MWPRAFIEVSWEGVSEAVLVPGLNDSPGTELQGGPRCPPGLGAAEQGECWLSM